MQAEALLQIVLNLKETKVTSVAVGLACIVAEVEPTRETPVCSRCFESVAKVHDRLQTRAWRTQDLCGVKLELRYRQRRVDCASCGVTVELVPWAEPGSKFTWDFEQQTAFLAQKCDKTTVAKTMRIAWHTVGTIVERVVKRVRRRDPLEGLRHIGVDEISYRKHHKYLTVVVDHDTRRIVWMHPGKNAQTLSLFFKELGPDRCRLIEDVTIDMSAAYIEAVTKAVPQARLTFDRFHVQRLVHDALDEVRREEVSEYGRTTPEGKALKRSRWAVQKSPWNLSQEEQEKLSELQRTNKKLYRAYLLKESLASILDRSQVNVARRKLIEWIGWALHSRLEPFARAARTLQKHLEGIVAYIQTGFSNGRTEGLNGKIRTLTRRSFGFHRVESLMAMIVLCCSGIALGPAHRDPLPHVV